MNTTDIFNDLSEHVSLRIHSCQCSEHDRLWVENKTHHDYDLWFVTAGRVHIDAAQQSSTAAAGDVILFYPNEPYMARTGEEGCRFVYVHFDFAIGEQFRILDDFELSGIVPGAQVHAESLQFLNAFTPYQSNESISSLQLKGTLYVFIAKLLALYAAGLYTGSFRSRPSTNDHIRNMALLQPVLRFIQSQLHKPISVRELASLAGMSDKYFITYFKKTVGLTPGQYIYQLKMNKARDYLYQKTHAVKDIAHLLGYPDPYTFSKAFKKYYHVPPSRFVR
ncbi:helix-turn-helix transcriptional regulator [Paenibacillus xerothermodurans]|uniref:AraC family transcriptional regulator n=1 Tax=Paenibacillus xerothermodurans TaxID=1977292 RepID=A0A2W1N6I2_PAEXE|nr:AraC family transcriptional regulator [Paenibacillus xerothermodurans]PZE20229.1 AraC family transcriptional regulator [Paenibacillus xerothermodurans]